MSSSPYRDVEKQHSVQQDKEWLCFILSAWRVSWSPTSLHNFNHLLISRSPKPLFHTLDILIYLTLRPQANQPITRKGNFYFYFFLQDIAGDKTCRQLFHWSDVWNGYLGQALLLEFSIYSILGHKASKKIFWMKRIHVFLAVLIDYVLIHYVLTDLQLLFLQGKPFQPKGIFIPLHSTGGVSD